MSDQDRTIPERPDERRNWLDGLAIEYALAATAERIESARAALGEAWHSLMFPRIREFGGDEARQHIVAAYEALKVPTPRADEDEQMLGWRTW